MNIYFIDLDGTIEDSKFDMCHAVNMVRKKLKLDEREFNYIEQHITRGMDELYRNCFSDYLEKNPNTYNIVKEEFEKFYLKNVCFYTKCYEGIPDAIAYLSQKGKVIVITNKPEKISRKLLNKLELTQYITDVMGGDSCAECKPSPLPLQIMAQKFGFNKVTDKAFMIGDSEGDIKTAMAFGAQSVWCAWGYLKETPKLKADIVVQFPSELKNL